MPYQHAFDPLRDSKHDELKADRLDGLPGEASHFAAKYGIFADGVSPWTASLPAGWDERLVRIEDPDSGAVACVCTRSICVWRRCWLVVRRTFGFCRRCSGPVSSILTQSLPGLARLRSARARQGRCVVLRVSSREFHDAIFTPRARLWRRPTSSVAGSDSHGCGMRRCCAAAPTGMVRCAGTLVGTAPNIPEAPGWRRLLRRCRRSATEPRRPWHWSGAVHSIAGGECLVGGGEKVGDGCGTDLYVEGAESRECLGCVGGGPRVGLVCGVG